MNIFKYFGLVWFKNIFSKLLIWDWCHSNDCHGVSLHDVLFQFCQWKMTLSRVSFFFKYRTLLHWCFIFFFSKTPVILKQFGLEHFSWSSSWLSYESTCCWRDGNFFKLDIRDLLLKWFMIEYDRDCFLSGIIIFWERFL